MPLQDLPPLPDHMEPMRVLYGQTNFVKLAFARLLQAAFGHESIPAEYRWYPEGDPGERSSQAQTQLWIYRASPNRETGLPAIFIESDPADCSIAQVGQEIMRYIYTNDPVSGKPVVSGLVYAGPLFIPVKLTVVATTTSDREIITDMVTSFVRFLFRSAFLKEKVEYLDIQAGDSGEEGDNPANRRFFGSLTVRCQTQMSQVVDIRLVELIESINLSDLKYGTSVADLTPLSQV